MSKFMYLECASGISGDMAVAALLDLGASEENLKKTLDSLRVNDPYEIKISKVKKSGLLTTDFDVILPKENDPHDHDMAYLYGHLDSREDGQIIRGEKHLHAGAAVHSHSRGPKEIAAIFDCSAMTDGAKKIAFRILDILTDAEAMAHGVPRDEVHFHEVGAIDSIIDIASFAICYDELLEKYQIEETVVASITEGTGSVRCQHGILPIPVPAVLNISAACGLKLHMTSTLGELVTPTGAAIAAAVKTKDQLPELMQVVAVGLGAGKRVYETAGFLRIMIAESDR